MTKVLLYQGQPGDTATTVVAAASITRTIDAACVCNTTAGAVTLTVHIGGTTAAHAVYSAMSVGAGETETLSALVNQCIPRGSVVSMTASAAASLTVTMSGREQ